MRAMISAVLNFRVIMQQSYLLDTVNESSLLNTTFKCLNVFFRGLVCVRSWTAPTLGSRVIIPCFFVLVLSCVDPCLCDGSISHSRIANRCLERVDPE